MTEIETKQTAYSYIRLSSKKQIDGDGERRQLEAAQEYCIANNLQLSPKSFKDLGISAFKEKNRPSLSDLHECIQNGTIRSGDVIILEKLDRLSRRGIDETISMLRSILQHGVELISLVDGLRLSRNSLNDLISIIRIAVASDLARQESETKSQRVRANKASMKKLAGQGVATKKRLPMWLTYSEGEYVLNDNADVVLRMFELRESGTPLGEIARRLNAEGVPTPNNRKWVASTVSMILGSASLYGAYQTLDRQQDGTYVKGTVIKDYYPALIEYSRWKGVQSSAVRIAGGHSKINHLSGLCFCVCGGAISFKKNNAQRKTKATYFYCRRHAYGTCDNRHCVRDLEKLVIAHSRRLDVENTKIGSSDSSSLIQQQIDEFEIRIAELGSSLSNVNGAVVTIVLNAITELEGKKKELIKELSQIVDIPMHAGSTLFQYADDPVRFNIELKKIVKRIEVTPSGKNHFIKMVRHDGHTISFHTADVLQPSDTKKLLNEVKTLTTGVEEWEVWDGS